MLLSGLLRWDCVFAKIYFPQIGFDSRHAGDVRESLAEY